MRKKLSTILFFILLLQTLFGQTALFLITNPPRATVKFEGTELKKTTPLLLENLDINREYSIEIRRAGFELYEEIFSLEEGDQGVKRIELQTENLNLGFPITGLEIEGFDEPPVQLGLPEGTYSLINSDEKEGFNVRPVWPQQNWLDTVERALPVSLLIASLLSIGEYIRFENGQEPSYAYLATAWGLNLSLFSADLYLRFKRDQWRSDWEPSPLSSSPELESIYFERGESALQEGSFQEAVEAFDTILDRWPDSSYYSAALYLSGRLSLLAGDRAGGIERLERLCNDWPDPESYDKACRSLAILYASAGDFDKAEEWIDRVLYFDDLVSRDEVFKLKELWSINSDQQ